VATWRDDGIDVITYVMSSVANAEKIVGDEVYHLSLLSA
jgi:hypothetical protein